MLARTEALHRVSIGYMLLLLTLCCVVASLSQSPLTAAALLRRRTNCGRNGTREIVFLALYPPCSKEAISSSEDLVRLDQCDVLVEAAVDLAVERINRNPGILPEGAALRVIPVRFEEEEEEDGANMDDKVIMKAQALANILRSADADNLWGVIGPSDPREAEFLAPIFHKENLVTISYGSETTTTDKISSFYRALPSTHASNFARLHLMHNFQWYRVAILPDLDNKHFELEAEQFVSLVNWILEYHGFVEYFDSITMFSPLSDSQPTSTALRQVQSANISIMFGLFGPEKARHVLCMANSMGLVSEKHAWVLPAYYRANWWKLPSNDSMFESAQLGNCTNEKMEEILESVIFIQNAKFPPVDLSLGEFHSQLVSKARDLFPSLTEEDLEPYLLRSRATSAYDAVTLLARSVGVTFDQHQDEGNCPSVEQVQTALERNMNCEHCRINSDQSGSKERCHQACAASSSKKHPLRQQERIVDPTFKHYGQVLFSQFIGGHEYPIKLLWTKETVLVESLHYYAISELDSAPLTKKLNLSAKDFDFINDSWLPGDFQWRGLSAPDSNFFKHTSLARVEVILIAMLVTCGLLVAIALLIFNIIWRNHKTVKASSPRLNVIFLTGIILTLPTALFESIAKSSTTFDPHRDLLSGMCYFKFWMYYLGEAMFITTLLLKNWRIYRIFYNKRLKNIGSQLSDVKLMVIILLMLLPVAAILIVWSAFDDIRFDFSFAIQDSKNLQLITVSACCSNHLVMFQAIFIPFTALPLMFLFVLTLLVANVQRIEFRREGLGSHRAVALAILPLPALYIAWAILLVHFPVLRYHALLWIEFALTGLIPMTIMIVLFAPNVYFIVRERVDRRRSKVQSAQNKSPMRRKQQSYHSFKRKAVILKSQLSQTQQMIAKLLAERQQQLESGLNTHPTLKDTTELTSISPDLIIHKKKRHGMHLMFSDLSVSTPTIDFSPQSTATLFTCIGSASDFGPSQCSSESLAEYASSLNEDLCNENASTDADNGLTMRLNRSVSDNGDNESLQGENSVHSSSSIELQSDIVGEEGYDLEVAGPSVECRRDRSSPLFFLFDVEELSLKSKHNNNNHNIIMTP